MASEEADNQAVAALVRQRDRDRYWCALFAPASRRADLLALYAFNAELARIPALVSEPMAGQIRLKWWRDVVEFSAPDRKTGNPAADALGAAIARHNLPKARLIEMIDAGVPGLFGEAPGDMQALELYFQETSATPFEMAAAILGLTGENVRDAATHAGLAFGLTHLLRTLPYQATQRKLLLPQALLEENSVQAAGIFRGERSAGLDAVLAELQGTARSALTRFIVAAPALDEAAWPAFLPLALARPYLEAMAKPGFDALHETATLSPLTRFWLIWRTARRKTI
jgi:phytoene synthase